MGSAFIRERGPKPVGQMVRYWLLWSTDYPYAMFAIIGSLARTGIIIMVVGICLNVYCVPAEVLKP